MAMSDALTTITKLINSPPGQLAAGGVLAGIVWKFFERVEAVLTDQTKLEIAVWLVGRKKFGPKVQPWPETFAKMFDRVFGQKHLSWKCFGRSCAASIVSALLILLVLFLNNPKMSDLIHRYFHGRALLWPVCLLSSNILPDYLSLLQTRYILEGLRRQLAAGKIIVPLSGALVITFLLSRLAVFFAALFGTIAAESGVPAELWPIQQALWKAIIVLIGPWVWLYPACFTSIWLWLYAGSGFVLKAARRFDLGFDWFNRHFDIEKKPLQSIGLVAGALVAVVYWMAVVVSRVVG